MLTLFTILIILTISELVVLIIIIFFLKSLFDCSYNIHFLCYWVRIHSCFFDSEHSLKFFKLENIMIVNAILNLFHESRDSNVVFEWEFFDQKQTCHSVLKELFADLLINFLNMIINCCKVWSHIQVLIKSYSCELHKELNFFSWDKLFIVFFNI